MLTAVERTRQWRADHPEWAKRLDRGQYAKNRTKRIAQARVNELAEFERNPGAFRARKRKTRTARIARHREHINRLEKVRQRASATYRIQHREQSSRRRAAKRLTMVKPVDFLRILARDGDRCHLCGGLIPAEARHFDHVIPLARGGQHQEENIRVAHVTCNLRKGGRMGIIA